MRRGRSAGAVDDGQAKDDAADATASRATRGSTRGSTGRGATSELRRELMPSHRSHGAPPPPRKPAPGRNATAGVTPRLRKSARRLEGEEEERGEIEGVDEEGSDLDGSDPGEQEERNDRRRGEEETGGRKRARAEVVKDDADEIAEDSDDDAPEEVSAAVAKGQIKQAQRAEAESRRAIAEKKKLANKQRELAIILSKQEKERAALKRAKLEARAAKRHAALEPLPSDVLISLAEKDEQQKEQAVLAAKKQSQHKYLPTGEEKTVVRNQGFVVQKIGAQDKAAETARAKSASAAESLLASHFSNVPRKAYAAVHVRKVGPSPTFAGTHVNVKKI